MSHTEIIDGAPVTILNTQERWKALRLTHANFINGSDLGPVQKKKALQFYRDIHWEAGIMKASDPGIITRVLTADPDPERLLVAFDCIDAAWHYIGWTICRKAFAKWSKAMTTGIEDLKATRKQGEMPCS